MKESLGNIQKDFLRGKIKRMSDKSNVGDPDPQDPGYACFGAFRIWIGIH